MATYKTTTTSTINGDIYLSIGSGGGNTPINSFIDSRNKFLYELEFKDFDKNVKPNLTMTFTSLDKWTSLISTIEDLVFVVYIGGSIYFKGFLDKPSILEDYKNNIIIFTIIQADYLNTPYSHTGSGTITFSTYLANIISNTTGSTINYVDSISWDLEDGTTTFLNSSDVTGSDSSIRLNKSEAYTIPFLNTLKKILQFELVEWKGVMYVVNTVRNTSSTTTINSDNLLDYKKNRIWTTDNNSDNYSVSMESRVAGSMDGITIFKIDYNSSNMRREIGSADLINAFDNHLYSYNTSGSRSPNWTDDAVSPNSVDFFYTFASGSSIEEVVRIRSVSRDTIELNLSTTNTVTTSVCDLVVQVRLSLISATVDDINNHLYFQIDGNDKKYVSGVDFQQQNVVYHTMSYNSLVGGDVIIGYDTEITTHEISSAEWDSGFLYVSMANWGKFDFEVGQSIVIEDVTNYTSTYILTSISETSSTTHLLFTTANNGTATAGANALLYIQQDIQIGLSDITIQIKEDNKKLKNYELDDGRLISDQVEITTSDAGDLNNELIDLFILKAISNFEYLNGVDKIRVQLVLKGEINPYKAISFEGQFYKIVKYKYDAIKNITALEGISI